MFQWTLRKELIKFFDVQHIAFCLFFGCWALHCFCVRSVNRQLPPSAWVSWWYCFQLQWLPLLLWSIVRSQSNNPLVIDLDHFSCYFFSIIWCIKRWLINRSFSLLLPCDWIQMVCVCLLATYSSRIHLNTNLPMWLILLSFISLSGPTPGKGKVPSTGSWV